MIRLSPQFVTDCRQILILNWGLCAISNEFLVPFSFSQFSVHFASSIQTCLFMSLCTYNSTDMSSVRVYSLGCSESNWIVLNQISGIKFNRCLLHELPITTLVPCYLCFITFLPCDAMLARYMLCACVCLSVTSQCSTKTDKRKIKRTTPHDSPGTLVFRRQGSPWNSTGNRGKPLAVKLVVSKKWCDIDILLLHTTNRKYHISYLFIPFPMTLDDLEGHLPNAGLIKFNSTNICATFSRFLTDTARRMVPRR